MLSPDEIVKRLGNKLVAAETDRVEGVRKTKRVRTRYVTPKVFGMSKGSSMEKAPVYLPAPLLNEYKAEAKRLGYSRTLLMGLALKAILPVIKET